MRAIHSAFVCVSLGLPGVCYADAPRVVTDIAPVHSLVSQIMDGVGSPDLLLPATASPHDYAMRPSDARTIQNADAIFWVGDALTPWLAAALSNLSGDAANIELLEAEGALRLDFREGAIFAELDYDYDHEKDHGHDDHDDHGHDDHGEEGDIHEGHDHSGVDPHAWLDPVNARVWLSEIASELSRLDPDNAGRYQSNLSIAQGRMDAMLSDLQAEMDGIAELRFVVLHDAYRYFEDRFGLRAVGAISESDASDPSAGRVRDIRQAIESEGISCLFTEAQLQSPLLEIIANETSTNVVTLDPLGALLAPGKDLYEQKMRGIAASFKAC